MKQIMRVVDSAHRERFLNPDNIEDIRSADGCVVVIQTISGREIRLATTEKIDDIISLWKSTLGIKL